MSDSHDAPEPPARKPFAAWLQEQGNGGLHAELSDALGELVSICVETGKKGTLQLKVDIAPQKDGATVLVSGDVAVKPPKHDARVSLFWPDEHGNLQRTDPRQVPLPFREVAGGKDADRELREAR